MDNKKYYEIMKRQVTSMIDYLEYDLNYSDYESQRDKRAIVLSALEEEFGIFVAFHHNLDSIIDILDDDRDIDKLINVIKNMFKVK